MSPELIAPQRFGLKSSRPTKSSDCYAFGMVIYETISGNLPFHKDTDLVVFVKVLEGERPPRGVRFREGLWRMLEQCWGSQPNDRPTIEDVLQCLEMPSNSSEPSSPEVDEGVDRTGRRSLHRESRIRSDR
jgi:serine/threonine protein kinase